MKSLHAFGGIGTVLALVAGLLAFSGPAAGINTNRTGRLDSAGFPTYYVDNAGVRLQLCDDGTPMCARGRPEDLRPPDGEALYWAAIANLRSRRGQLQVEFALEAAFNDRGRPTVFSRLRIRGHLSRRGQYILRHPFGTKRFVAKSPREQRNVNITIDRPCALVRGGRCPTRVDTWLRSVAPRPGYLGRGEGPTRVRGGSVRNRLVLRVPGRGVIGRQVRFGIIGKKWSTR